MKPIERVIISLGHKEPDRVPVYPILSGVTRKLVGATYEKWSTDAETCADALIKAQEQFDLDCIVTLIDLSLEADAWNAPVIYASDAAAHPDYSKPVIKDIDEYSKIKKADYKTSKRMMMHIDVCRRLVEAKGSDVPIIAFVFGPLGILSMLRNQQDLYTDIYDDPEAVLHAASEINETLKDYCNALIDVGVHGIMLDTLFASSSIMSKSMWLEMEGGLVHDLTEIIHKRGALVLVHNCGEGIYFDAQIETMNPCAISFLHPPADCKDFVECKEKYGGKITLIGCVPPPMVVLNSNEEWSAECRKQIDLFAKGGGYMLATGCEYPSDSSFEKAQIMVDIAKDYGKY